MAKVGILGHGVVGSGVAQILLRTRTCWKRARGRRSSLRACATCGI